MSANINRATSSIILLAVLLLCVCVGVDAACSKVVEIEHSTLFGGQGGQDGGHVNRHLRAGVKKYGDRDDRDEERAIGSTTDWLVASTKKLWGETKPSRQQTETADDLFAILKTEKHSSAFFKNPVFQKWVERVGMLHPGGTSTAKDLEILDKLTGLYGANAVAGMIVTAKKSLDTKAVAIASKLENIQVKNWIIQGNNVDDVLRLLKLDEEGKKLLNNSAVNLWASFATKFNGNHADEMMFSSLKKQGFNDADLFNMILGARQGRTKDLAKRLEEAQLADWVAKENTVDDVRRLLKLGQGEHKFFDQPAVRVWVSFATKLDEGRADEMLLASLKTLYGDEALATVLFSGRYFGRWKSVASRLEQQYWLSEGLTAEQALKRLTDGGENIFKDHVTNLWFSYVTKLAKAGENPRKTALSILQGHFENEWELAGKIANGLNKDPGRKALKELQRQQFQQWRDQGLNFRSVSAKLEKHVGNPFTRDYALDAARDFFKKRKS